MTAEVCAGVKELVELLAVESYREMGQRTSDELAARLGEVATRLETALVALGGFPAGAAAQTPPAAGLAFALAQRLSALYPDTVGDAGAVVASLPLPAMRRIRSGHGSPEAQAAVFERLAARLGLSETAVAEVEAEFHVARAKLRRRRQQVGLQRAELPPNPGPPEAHEFFGRFFPEHPLWPGEVDVAATESCLYFILLSNEAFARTDGFLARDEAGRKHTLDYLERLRRFNFSNFSHFPAFTSFDAREMDPGRGAAGGAPRGGGAPARTASCTIAPKSAAVHFRRPYPTREKPGGSSPRFARS